ncbi:sensor histidine kinase [Bacillus sp. FJAT-49736]|uniref:sensor histidine kinase n=1 Tax=Bacillus sp. FJAT-49736 TaxID=2833582 RepID=UPI001BCA6250|nr:sensor histidine kinase [Bacillus sp. FJAT-49736]MBS4175257.1 sensor histidine kinase [Bacillus sp. FJAT-49736]
MKWQHYLKDNRYLLITYFIVLLLTSIIILLDPELKIHISNLLYLLLLISLLFLIYIFFDYRRKKAFYRELADQIETSSILELFNTNYYEEKLITQLLTNQKQQYEKELERLKKEQKEWNEYIATWVHEIKTPISVSKMIFETETISESLEEEMWKIEHLVDQSLYYARASDFNKDYLIQEINVEQIIKEAIKDNRKVFLSKKIKLELHLSAMEVLSDKKGLRFIMDQILSNSLKYTPSGGKILIEIPKDERRIIIRDNGIGIPAEDIPRIFEKGFTGNNGRQFAASTGMGLYLAKKIASKLGHQLTVHSIEGSYTELSIQFSKNVELLKEEFHPFNH